MPNPKKTRIQVVAQAVGEGTERHPSGGDHLIM
jgi:hypothetical protein